jgi:hypothetical protein
MFATVSSPLTWGLSPRREPLPSPTQLPFPHPSTHPGTRKSRHNQSQRIPVRPKRYPAIPRRSRTDDAHHETKNPWNHRVPHRPVRRQPRRHITTQNAKDDPIHRCQRQRTIARRLPRGRKDSHRIQDQIRHKSQRNRDHDPGNHSPNAPANASGRVHSPPRSQIPSSLRQLTTIHPLFRRSLSAPGSKAQQTR